MERAGPRGNSYHLIIEDFRSHPLPKERVTDAMSAGGEFITLQIPDKGALIVVNENCQLEIVDRPYGGEEDIFVFQPLWNTPDPHLLMVCPGRGRPMINAVPSPPIALLKVKDEILFPNNSGCIVHVSIFSRPCLGPPPVHRIGRKCPICRSKLLKKSLTYTCFQCGQIIHYNPGGKSNSDALDCANHSDNCPVCRAKIHLNDGFVYWPDFLRERG